MKKQLQQGFTLIELMIVVAIIGILAAIAIPAYQNYLIRAQVSEGPSLLDTVQTAFSEYYANTGSAAAATGGGVGTGIPAIGLTNAISGKYVSAVAMATGQVTITYGNSANNAIKGGTVIWTPYADANGDISWLCNDGTTTTATLAANTALKPVTGGAAAKTGSITNASYLPNICN
jgi:type IV pilus assembly protein PilA